MQCLLCGGTNLKNRLYQVLKLQVFHCADCDLIFKPPETFWSLEKQKDRYDLHQNSADNPGYENFLLKFVNPLLPFLSSSAQVLDWGSGPELALMGLLEKKAFRCSSYDPIYQPQLPQQKFDAVVSTEVVEHFTAPWDSFVQMSEHVKPGGVLAGMTEFHSQKHEFEDWWYAKDPTHICFYSAKTIAVIAQKLSFSVLHNRDNVFVLRK